MTHIVLAISHVSSKFHLSAFFLMCHRSTVFFTKSLFLLILLRGSSKFYDETVEVVPPRLLSHVVSSGFCFRRVLGIFPNYSTA